MPAPVPASAARRALACVLALSLAWGGGAPVAAQTGAVPPAAIALPSLGDDAAETFSVTTEARLGERIMREVRRDPAYLDDPELVEYLQSLWQPLMAAARRKGEIPSELDARFAWEVFLVRDRSVNAFALPGGTVGTHLGLIAITQTPDELASVLAHELSHVTQRHIARGFASSRRQTMLAVAGMILGVIAASRANSADGMSAAVVGSQAASVQAQLNFSRDMEREADRVGFSVLTQAGFEPLGMAAMFERLQAASRLNDSGGFPYLRTHPLTGERVAEARARVGLGALSAPAAAAGGAAGGAAALPDAAARALAAVPVDAALLHAVAVARSRVLGDPRDESLARLAAIGLAGAPGGPGAGAGPGPFAGVGAGDGGTAVLADRLANAYAAALAASMRRDPVRAQAALAAARSVVAAAALSPPTSRSAPVAIPTRPSAPASLEPVRRSLALLAAELAVARGDPAAALAELAPLQASGTRVVMLRLAEATLADAQAPAPALRARGEALQTWLASHPADALAWALSAQVWERLELPLRSLRAQAEARYALGDLTGASDRLRAGQQLARRTPLDSVDAIESSVIDTRLREVDELRRQIFLEERGGAGR